MNLKFERSKFAHQLQRTGQTFSFYRNANNDFGEPTGSSTLVTALTGIFHVTKSGASKTKTTSDGAQTRLVPSPAIMTLAENAETIKMGDTVEVNGKKYNVLEVSNLFEWNIISDISLEGSDDGE